MKGHYVPLSSSRKMVQDFLYASSFQTLATGEKHVRLGDLPQIRELTSPRPSWCAIFTKALATVISRNPRLRRAFVTLPWSRMFQYDENVAGVVVERGYNSESTLLIARVRSPETMSILDLDEAIHKYKNRSINSLSGFRGAKMMARMPQFLRRLFWGALMTCMPRLRGKMIGTFGVSVTAGQGGSALFVPAPWTLTLHYDEIKPDGTIDMRLTFDHRVLDGYHIAMLGIEAEELLRGPIRDELLALQQKKAA
jgi:hypothetical protein